MAIKKIEIQDHQGNVYHPHTTSDVVFMPDGRKTSDVIINGQNHKMTADNGYAIQIVEGQDLDNYKKSGLYMGQKLVNAPNAEWYFYDIKAHNDKFIMQEATTFTNAIKTTKLVRSCVNGIWGDWRSL